MELGLIKEKNLEISELPFDYNDFKPEFRSTPMSMDNLMVKPNWKSSKNFSEVFDNCYLSKNVSKPSETSKNLNINHQLKYQSQVLNSIKELNDSEFSNTSIGNKSISEKVKMIVERLWNDQTPHDCDNPKIDTEDEKVQNSSINYNVDSLSKVESLKEYNQTVSWLKYDKTTQTYSNPADICAYKYSKINKIKNMPHVLKKLKIGMSKHGCNFKVINHLLVHIY